MYTGQQPAHTVPQPVPAPGASYDQGHLPQDLARRLELQQQLAELK